MKRLLSGWKRVPFRTKLIGTLLLVIALNVVTVYWLTARSVSHQFSQFTSRRFTQRAEALAPLLVSGYYAEHGGWEGLQQALRLPEGLPPPRPGPHPLANLPLLGVLAWIQEDLVLADEEGRVVFDGDGTLLDRQLPERVLAQGVPLVYEEQRVGTMLSGTALKRFSPVARQFLRSLNRSILLAGLVAALAALALGGVLVRTLARPLNAVAQAAERIASGELEQRVEVASLDEVGRLAASFNAMSAKLKTSEGLRRQLVADVAHELRTPVSVIRGDLEALVDGVYPPTQASFQSLLEETQRLARLIADLRELSLLDAGELPLERRATDLGALAEQRVAAFLPQAAAGGVTLTLRAQAVPKLVGDPDRLAQVLDNLLSNALRHTPRGGRIGVELLREGAQVVCAVRDSGSGVRPEDLARVFERCWRGDRSRARHSGGSGLGLSIAKRLVEAHGGTMWADSKPGQGSTFGFRLPCT